MTAVRFIDAERVRALRAEAARHARGAMSGPFGARAVGLLLLGVAAFTGIEGWQRL